MKIRVISGIFSIILILASFAIAEETQMLPSQNTDLQTEERVYKERLIAFLRAMKGMHSISHENKDEAKAKMLFDSLGLNKDALLGFAEEYPKSPYATDIKLLFLKMEPLGWDDSLKGWDSFMKLHPNGKLSETTIELIAKEQGFDPYTLVLLKLPFQNIYYNVKAQQAFITKKWDELIRMSNVMIKSIDPTDTDRKDVLIQAYWMLCVGYAAKKDESNYLIYKAKALELFPDQQKRFDSI